MKTNFPVKTTSVSDQRVVKRLSRRQPSYGAHALSYPKGGLSIPLAMRLIRGVHPVVRMTVNGSRTLDVLVDTGTTRTFVAPGVFGERYGKKSTHLQKFCFENSVCFEEAAVRATPTNYSQDRHGYYNGILGIDLLRYTGVSIDYKNSQIYLGDPETEPDDGKVIRTAFHMDKKTWRPHAMMTIGAVAFPDVLLDTGSSFTRLTPAMVSKLEAVPAAAYLELAFLVDSVQGTEILWLPDVCVNRVACVPTILGQKSGWPAVGGTFFRNFLTTFDFRKNELALRPYAASWSRPRSAMQRLGLQIDILDAENVVLVGAGSPAALAGITTGATLWKINGRSAHELGYLGVHEILEDPKHQSFDIAFRDKDGLTRLVHLKVRMP